MNALRLPACLDHDLEFALTPEEKRELIVAIAERGPGAIDEFLAKKGKESRFARALARWRERLIEEARKLRQRLESGYQGRRSAVLESWRTAEEQLEKERDEAERALRGLSITDDRLAEALGSIDLVRILERSPKAADLKGLRGLAASLRRWWRHFVGWWARLLRGLLRLFGVGRKASPEPTRTAIVPLGVARFADLDVRLHEALVTDPQLRREVRRKLRMAPLGDRVDRLWQRLLGRTDYEQLAMQLMREEAEAKVREQDERLRREREELQRRLDDLRLREAEEARRRDEGLTKLDRDRDAEQKALEQRLKDSPAEALRDEVVRDLEASGLVETSLGVLTPTARLIDRFAEMVFLSEMRALPSRRASQAGSAPLGEGLFTKEPMRSLAELAHVDIVESLANARLRHPHVRHLTEQDVVVYRESRAPYTHVVIIFDTSGSMEENDRMLAAKKAVFALMRAVKQDARENPVDLVAMDTSVRRVDLLDAWKASPHGFTNTGAAMRLAYEILKVSRGDRRLVFLVTDGLPEAYTTPDGIDVAGRPEKCLDYALEQARKLRGLPGVGVTMVLLEPRDPLYVQAAEALAKEVGGKVLKTDPKDLAKAMLLEYDVLARAKRPELLV